MECFNNQRLGGSKSPRRYCLWEPINLNIPFSDLNFPKVEITFGKLFGDLLSESLIEVMGFLLNGCTLN